MAKKVKAVPQDFIRDAIHKNIKISDSVISELIACKEFQRLRGILQLAGAQVSFPSATHTRFTHSLGVYHVLSRVFEEVQGAQEINPADKLIVKIAGLLHDLGHGPFSHAFEKVTNLNNLTNYQYHHEYYTCIIIEDENTEVHQVLKKHHIDIAHLCAIIKKDETKCPKYQIQLVSSQLDCDRIDYLIRDAYFTGTNYGAIDLDWVITNMIIDEKHGILFTHKALSAIENYLITRFHMYQQVYFHKSSIFFDLKLQKLFTQLVHLLKHNYSWKINLQKVMPILKQEVLQVGDYLELTDATIISLLKDIISHETDPELLMWAKALLYNQCPYKMIVTKNTSQVGEQVLKNRIYDLNKEPIMIQLDDGSILPLDKVSQLFENPTNEQKIYYRLEKNS